MAGEEAVGELIGKGLYTPAEAGKLLHVSPLKIIRWLRGHSQNGKVYDPLWHPSISLGDEDERVFLAFRDLMEVRVADAFIQLGISSFKVRAAIALATKVLGRDYPLSSDRFRTDGREIFLRIIETDKDGREPEKLLNLFKKQFEFKNIIDPILKSVDFGEWGEPVRWWPEGKPGQIVLDPQRSFGQPIDAVSSVPTQVLSAAGTHLGIKQAALAYDVPETSVKRALAFEDSLNHRVAA